MGDGRGMNATYSMGTNWDVLTRMVDKEVKNGNGRLIYDKKRDIYGLNILGYQILFRNEEGNVIEVNPEQILPMGVEQYRIDLKKKLGGLLN